MSPEKSVRLAKKSPGTQQMVKAEYLDLRQDEILSLPFTSPSPHLSSGSGVEKSKWGEERGHLQLNKIEGWHEAKMKEEKTKREGCGEEDRSKERIIWGCLGGERKVLKGKKQTIWDE